MPIPPPPPPADDILVVEVVAEAPVDAAASRSLDRTDLTARPARSAEDWLRATPGLHLASHGGPGKPQQYLIRGFDAEHGTAFAVDVEGIPMNEPSNLHGHGYVDLAVVPSALVERLEVRAGAPRPRDGAFGIAGTASYGLGLADPGLAVTVGGGSDASGQATVAWRPDRAPSGSFLLGEIGGGTGGAPGRAFRMARAGAGVQHTLGAGDLRAFVLAGATSFTNPGVLRPEDFAADPYGAYDHAGGGLSRRILGGTRWQLAGDRAAVDVTAWGGLRDLDLDQAFTGFLHHPTRGDGTHQDQTTSSTGLRSAASVKVTKPLWWRVGADLRHDAGSSAEQSTRAGCDDDCGWGPTASTDWRYAEAAAWTELAVTAGPLEVTPGVRATHTAPALPGGTLGTAFVGPAARGSLDLGADVAVLAQVGRGYAPATAHDPGDGGVRPAESAEVGLRVDPGTVDLRVTGFATRVVDEPLFDHAAGKALSAGDSARRGVALVASWQPLEAWRVDADVTAVDARRIETGEPLPYAPRWIGGLGVSALHLHAGPGHLTAGVFGRLVGPRPLPHGLVAPPVATADATATYDIGDWAVALTAENLAGPAWQEGQFVFASDPTPGGASSLRPVPHIAAGMPRTVRGTVTWRL